MWTALTVKNLSRILSYKLIIFMNKLVNINQNRKVLLLVNTYKAKDFKISNEIL